MIPLTFTCRKSDLRHIRISCRCGNVSVAEVPQQVARAQNLHPCPGCGVPYIIQQLETGKWDIKRLPTTMSDVAIMEAQPKEKRERHSYLGLRIRIVDGGKLQMGDFVGTNPHPEHIGKLGTVIAERDICGTQVPEIKLDDGTQLSGAECWWEPVVS